MTYIYLPKLIWLVLNYNYPKMMKKETPKFILIHNYILKT